MTSLERLAVSNDAVNSYFHPLLTTSVEGHVGCLEVTEPQELGPYVEFGTWLREKRIAAKLKSQPQAEVRARTRGLKLINQGKLSHIERGMNGNPDPEFLAQIAELYSLKYSEVIERWMCVRFKISTDTDSGFSGQGRTGKLSLEQRKGETNASTAARLRELQDRVTTYKAILRKVGKHAAAILANAGTESRTATGTESRRSRSDRGTR